MCSVKLALTAIGFELALYLLFKLIRCDMRHFMWDSFPPGVHFIISTLYRIIKKVMFDFNGQIQDKHTYDMGGFYMSLCSVWVQVFPYIALKTYFDTVEPECFDKSVPHSCFEIASDDGTADVTFKIETNEISKNAYLFLAVINTVWIATAITMFAVMPRKYWKTFFSLQTAPSYCQSNFKTSTTDAARFDNITCTNKNYWLPIKDDVAKWFKEGYPIWKREKPDWYDEDYSHRVAVDLLPAASLQDRINESGSSLNLKPRHSLRDSIKKQRSLSTTTAIGDTADTVPRGRRGGGGY